MADSRAALRSGSFTVQAQERIVFGEPAESAVRSEAERYSAKRIFVISTRSLDRVADGPLQKIVAALESRCVGTFAAIRAHTPREDVIAAASATQAQAKQSFAHRLFVPRSVILDPAATLHTPAGLLYSTGIRAVDHAVESYCSPLANPATEPLSLQALRLLGRALQNIKADPGDLDARLEAQFGMWQSILPGASGVSIGASHGIGYVLGGTFGVAHGHTSCVMLPAVLRWNAAVNAERQRALADALGADDRPAADLIAERALTYAAVRGNPRPIRSAADVKEILELAY